MGNIELLLNEIRAQIAPTDEALDEARRRREVVLNAGMTFRGTREPFNSGSLAHRTANCPIHRRDKGLDADCGIVLDRRSHSELGPDGWGIGPNEIVRDVMRHITGRVQEAYPRARLSVSKRAILVEPKSPLSTGEDPTVDLIVGLDRRSADGLWIPNTRTGSWDPSHPQEHTAW